MLANPPRMVILSYGMGVESTAIILRWLEDPASRDFDLTDLIIITAMTGDEFADTGRLVEEHILPRLRQHGVRYVQVARGGRLQEEGVAILDDSQSLLAEVARERNVKIVPVAEVSRVEVMPRKEGVYPSLEEVYVVAPAVVMEKVNKGFARAAETLEEVAA